MQPVCTKLDEILKYVKLFSNNIYNLGKIENQGIAQRYQECLETWPPEIELISAFPSDC